MICHRPLSPRIDLNPPLSLCGFERIWNELTLQLKLQKAEEKGVVQLMTNATVIRNFEPRLRDYLVSPDTEEAAATEEQR